MEVASGQGPGQATALITSASNNPMEESSPKDLVVATGPRPHRCEVCQRSFREIATLRKHEQLHRADRPYICTTCGKSFLWSSNLKVHERVHTGERPYKCKICYRCFTQSNDLRRHERNVHMRGKIYGCKNASRPTSQNESQQVNLTAYQAFALQQRALLQQALTYETYLQKAGQNTQLFHHSQGMGLTGHPSPPNSSPTSSVKLEQVTPPSTPNDIDSNGLEKKCHMNGSPHRHETIHSPVKVTCTSSVSVEPPAMSKNSQNFASIKIDGADLPHSQTGSLPSFSSFRAMPKSQDDLHSSSVGHIPASNLRSHLCDSHTLPQQTNRLSMEMINFHKQQHHHHNNNSVGAVNGSIHVRRTPPPPLLSQGMTSFDKNIDIEDHRRDTNHHHHSTSMDLSQSAGDCNTDIRENGSHGLAHDSSDHVGDKQQQNRTITIMCSHQQTKSHCFSHDHVEPQATLNSPPKINHEKFYPCDSVMDLSMNKTSISPASKSSISNSSNSDREIVIAPTKTTSKLLESELDQGKKDVTTTSGTNPTADSGGTHHCTHCNIFFYDYTMFHLHESLHMPYENHPFRCPSCGTHCQDKVEFMFHTVWHVKYPHTIPNYTPFKDGFLSPSP